MTRLIKLLILIAVLISSPSCKKEQLELEYTRQEEQIDRYISSLLSKDPSFKVSHNKGSNRVTLIEGDGAGLTAKGKARIIYAVYIFTGNLSQSNMIATNDAKLAGEAGWDLTDLDTAPYTLDMSDKDLISGLRNGLEGVKAGEECQIIFSGKYGFGNKHNNIINKNQALLYHILVESIE